MPIARLFNSVMLLVRGQAGGTALTGTVYERDEQAPSFEGAPNHSLPFVWVCDEFYAVDSGGIVQSIDGEDINIAFESPLPRGFRTRQEAITAARDHLRTQFARVGVDPSEVQITCRRVEDPVQTAPVADSSV